MDAVTLALAKAYTNSQRNGYVETVSRNAVPETTMNFQPMEDLGGLCAAMITVPFDLNNGETLEVMWDGVKYTCEYTFDEYGQFGDHTMAFESFPFTYSFDPSANMGIFVTTTEGDHTFSITVKSEVVHKIEPKFIPGYIQEITFNVGGTLSIGAVGNTRTINLEGRINKTLTEVAKLGMPILLKLDLVDSTTIENRVQNLIGFMNLVRTNDSDFFTGVFNGVHVNIIRRQNSEAWGITLTRIV